MARGINKAVLLGHVGQDPEMKYTSGGVAVVHFSIATNESWKDETGKLVEKTTWHNCTAWRKLAEIISEYVKKGSKIYVEGKIENSTYEKDGVKHYSSKVIVDEMLMLDSKPNSANQSMPERFESPSSVAKSEVPKPVPPPPKTSPVSHPSPKMKLGGKVKPSKSSPERSSEDHDLPF